MAAIATHVLMLDGLGHGLGLGYGSGSWWRAQWSPASMRSATVHSRYEAETLGRMAHPVASDSDVCRKGAGSRAQAVQGLGFRV